MNFVTIDVETANTDVGSICQIGMAKYIKRKLIDTYYSFVLPQTNFSRTNIEIHENLSEKKNRIEQEIKHISNLLKTIKRYIRAIKAYF